MELLKIQLQDAGRVAAQLKAAGQVESAQCLVKQLIKSGQIVFAFPTIILLQLIYLNLRGLLFNLDFYSQLLMFHLFRTKIILLPDPLFIFTYFYALYFCLVHS